MEVSLHLDLIIYCATIRAVPMNSSIWDSFPTSTSLLSKAFFGLASNVDIFRHQEIRSFFILPKESALIVFCQTEMAMPSRESNEKVQNILSKITQYHSFEETFWNDPNQEDSTRVILFGFFLLARVLAFSFPSIAENPD